MKIDRIEHFVLTIADLAATSAFCCEALGMESVTFGEGRHALQFGRQKINLHIRSKELELRVKLPTPGSGDFYLISHESVEA